MSTKKNKSKQKIQSFRPKLPQERHSSSPARDELTKRQKVIAIRKALKSEPVDIATLKQLAISCGGLINNELRQQVYVKLLNIDMEQISRKPVEDVLHAHRDYNQVVLDVNRSLKRFPPGMETDHRMAMQDQLVEVIMRVLVANPELHYYQGYHDICVTFLLVAGEEIAFAIMDKLSRNHLREFMDINMERTNHMLYYLYPIIGKVSQELREFMEKSEVGTVFSLSWLITWYGHVLNDISNIVRFYDFFMACHQLMPIYLAAAIVLHRKKEVLATECEMCYVHATLSKIPADLPYEALIIRAGDLFVQYPPKELQAEAKIELKRAALKAEEELKLRTQNKVLKQNAKKYKTVTSGAKMKQSNILVKVTVWTFAAALSAAAYTMLNSGIEWNWFS